jgi:hypothetical protein
MSPPEQVHPDIYAMKGWCRRLQRNSRGVVHFGHRESVHVWVVLWICLNHIQVQV